MKKFTAILITLFLAGTFTVNAVTSNSKRLHKRHQGRIERPGNNVGAPLDGGLLTVLGAAGVAYYVSRKKNKTPQA